MCRSIRQLRRAPDAGPATTGEAEAAALQYVRKITGYRTPAARNAAAFDAAVAEIAAITERLIAATGTAVKEGPDPWADPVARKAIIEARDAGRPPRGSRPVAAPHPASGGGA